MPVTRILPLALRVGAVAVTAYTAWSLRRAVVANRYPGRLDQRAEDALDALDEGTSLHRSTPLGDGAEGEARQTNATVRLRRTVHFAGKTVEIDAGVLARLRVRQV